MALAGLAILPAAAVAITAAALPIGADAELIALGNQLEPLVDAYYAASRPWADAIVQRNSELDGRFGSAMVRNIWNTPEYIAAAKEVDDRVGLRQADDQLSAIWEQIDPLRDAINAMPCTSIEGLYAKALLAF
jgi:hypothetical protein